jgi:hypothetical protein
MGAVHSVLRHGNGADNGAGGCWHWAAVEKTRWPKRTADGSDARQEGALSTNTLTHSPFGTAAPAATVPEQCVHVE